MEESTMTWIWLPVALLLAMGIGRFIHAGGAWDD